MKTFIEKIIKLYKKNNEIPQLICHYSNIDSVLGILNSNSFWASDIEYLNDKNEFKYSIDLISDRLMATLQYQLSKTTDKLRRTFYKTMIELMDRKEILNEYQIFVVSFSTKNDLLSQWRGYCPDNFGLSVGLSLKENIYVVDKPEYSIYLLPCFYDKVEYDEIIQELIESFFNELIANMEKYDIVKRDMSYFDIIYNKYINKYLLVSSIIKDESFSEEDEWRLLVVTKIDTNSSNLNFRKGESLMIPYIEIPITDVCLEFSKIIIGPTRYPVLSKKSLFQLTEKYNLNFEIINSKIPYRKC